ncbi:MAG TPA: patatin-like phospholipase family protein [Usitatibacteraceae bacterium]
MNRFSGFPLTPFTLAQAGAALALAMLVGGCAVTFENTPRNMPAIPEIARPADAPRAPDSVVGENAVALSFSGGGLRAAAYALGVLQGLEDMPAVQQKTLLDDLTFVTSVSGGSMTAAYYGLHGKDTLKTFREEGLLRDGEADLRFSLFNPVNLARLLAGGLNDRSNFQRWLEQDLFQGATYADMFRRGKPIVWINATHVYQRMSFPFNQRVFDALCSDLASFPVSEAVAASMAVPVFFVPIVLEKHPNHCTTDLPDWVMDPMSISGKPLLTQALARSLLDLRDTRNGRYVKLIDGGVTDNFGLVSILQARLILGTPYGPLTEHDAITVRNMLFVVADAGQGPNGSWLQQIAGPSGIDLATAAIDAAVDANVRLSYDGFVLMMKNWRDDIVRYRCSLDPERIADIRKTQPAWTCADVTFSITHISFADLGPARARKLETIPTRLKLPSATVDELIAAGRDSVLRNDVIRAYQSQVIGSQP